jgi:hypothetical protein
MSAPNQISVGEGITLHSPEYRYLLNAANIVTLLGAQTAELGVTGRGVEFFAMKTFDVPKWRFLAVVGRPRPAPGRAIVAHPGKIAGALHIAGAPEPQHYSYTDVYFGNGVARFVGPDGTAEISGRITAAGSGRSAIPRGVEPLAEMIVDRYYLVSGVLLALGRGYYGAYTELKLTKEPDDRWKLHVLTDAGDDYSFFIAKMYRPPEVQFRGLYKAWTLSELLMLLGNYVKLEFLGSVDEPALYASWDDMFGGEDDVVPVHVEFYLEGST